MTDIRVAQVHYPVTVLGPGTRLGIWLQGCHIGCRGCVARDTWDPDAVVAVPVGRLVRDCTALVTGELHGVTISGGEPFEQPEALAVLLASLRSSLATLAGAHDIDYLCYSGFRLRDLQRRFPDLLAAFDAVIAEPFVAAQAGDDPWRGSSNQPVVTLTALGQRRYGGTPAAGGPARAVQVQVTAGRMTFIGIPRRGDLSRVERRLTTAGIALEQVSWRP